MICPLCESVQIESLLVAAPLVKEAGSARYFLCADCDLRFLHPEDRLDADSEKARYLLHNNDMQDIRYENFVRPLFTEVLKACQEVSPGLQTDFLSGLDYGAGRGPILAQLFADQGCRISLYDPFFWPDRTVLNQSYDFIVACEVAEHFYNPGKEFLGLQKILKPQGVVGLMTDLVTDKIDFATWYYRKDPTHVVFYSAKTISWIAKKYNFSFQISQDRVVVFKVEAASRICNYNAKSLFENA
ncbi:MAG: class I SAM-dependent methyltransferase [Pseudobdellovibrionaceae bacterium]